MKIIDMHTHIFPEKIAAKTLAHLSSIIQLEPYTNGMKEGLIQSSEDAGITLSVVQPVVTKVEQFDSINRFAMTLQEGPLLSFGGIHPADETYKERLRYLKDSGLKGIKIHPDYQDIYFDDIRVKRLVSYANEIGLIVLTHAGIDPLCPDDIHCKPKMIHKFLKEVQPEKLILAHMGVGSGEDMKYLEEYIIGQDVYLDTAYVLRKIPEERLKKAFKMHDSNKILFATDSPWSSQKEDADYLRNLKIDPELKEKIAWKNAADLLAINI